MASVAEGVWPKNDDSVWYASDANGVFAYDRVNIPSQYQSASTGWTAAGSVVLTVPVSGVIFGFGGNIGSIYNTNNSRIAFVQLTLSGANTGNMNVGLKTWGDTDLQAFMGFTSLDYEAVRNTGSGSEIRYFYIGEPLVVRDSTLVLFQKVRTNSADGTASTSGLTVDFLYRKAFEDLR